MFARRIGGNMTNAVKRQSGRERFIAQLKRKEQQETARKEKLKERRMDDFECALLQFNDALSAVWNAAKELTGDCGLDRTQVLDAVDYITLPKSLQAIIFSGNDPSGRIDYTRLHNVTHSVEEPYQTHHLPSEDMGD
jgi:hypothetical protein